MKRLPYRLSSVIVVSSCSKPKGSDNNFRVFKQNEADKSFTDFKTRNIGGDYYKGGDVQGTQKFNITNGEFYTKFQ